MEKHVLLLAITACTFSFSGLAQYNERFQVDLKAKNSRLIADRISQKELTIVSYKVEEKINMKFGSTITTYSVPSVDLINTNDLGDNNTRIVTPKYARTKPKRLNNELTMAPLASITVEPMQVNVVIRKEKKSYVKVNILRTYERVLAKGYLSTDMLKKVADWRYFDGDLEAAEHWYTELYCITPDLETTFYYRYAQCLKSIGEKEKAKEMMEIFETKDKK